MTGMDEREQLTLVINNLKVQLKLWEIEFEKKQGRAPTKADIKANREMCKYL